MIGHSTGFLCTLKGLPRSYNKDLQEDKEALFDTLDSLHSCLKVQIIVLHVFPRVCVFFLHCSTVPCIFVMKKRHRNHPFCEK